MMDKIASALDLSDLRIFSFPMQTHLAFQLLGHHLQRNIQNPLTGHDFFTFLRLRVVEHDALVQDIQPRFRPNVVTKMSQFLPDFSEMLHRDLGLIPKRVQNLDVGQIFE